MKNENKNRQSVQSTYVIGGVLIVLGILFLLGQVFNFGLGHYLWPFYIIVPGVLLFLFALTLVGKRGEWLAIVGSLVTMVGLLLLYQNTFEHFQSWAYAWALVVPTSVGLGQVIYGSIKDQGQLVSSGKRLVIAGGAIFLVGGIFFEFIIGISGFGLGRLGRFAWPLLLIVVGILVLFRALWSSRSTVPTQAAWEAEDPTQKLNGLKEMLDEGLITEDEYEVKKAEILATL